MLPFLTRSKTSSVFYFPFWITSHLTRVVPPFFKNNPMQHGGSMSWGPNRSYQPVLCRHQQTTQLGTTMAIWPICGCENVLKICHLRHALVVSLRVDRLSTQVLLRPACWMCPELSSNWCLCNFMSTVTTVVPRHYLSCSLRFIVFSHLSCLSALVFSLFPSLCCIRCSKFQGSTLTLGRHEFRFAETHEWSGIILDTTLQYTSIKVRSWG